MNKLILILSITISSILAKNELTNKVLLPHPKLDEIHKIHLDEIEKHLNIEKLTSNTRNYGESSILGHIAIPANADFQHVLVELHNPENEGAIETRTVDSMGNFQIACLGAGDYKIKAIYNGSENYPNQIWYNSVIDAESAQTITLSENQEVTDIDILFEECIQYVAGVDNNNHHLPRDYELFNNHPNPFNPTTTLSYALPKDGLVKISIYDLLGKEIRTLINNKETAGYKSIQWNALNNNGTSVSAGLYLYRIEASNFVKTKKMLLLK